MSDFSTELSEQQVLNRAFDKTTNQLQTSGGTPAPSTSGSTSSTAPLNSTSTAYEASRVAKASAGTLFGLSGYNSKTSSQFIQVHDAAALPSDTAVPVITFPVNASSPFTLDFGSYGRRFANGIVVCNSSTGPTKTIGSADLWLDVQYR